MGGKLTSAPLKHHTRITCDTCDGHGQVASFWDPGVPDECPDCGGSGVLIQYGSGAIAKWYGGPLLSGPSRRAALKDSTNDR